ncbi:MAG: terpene cyclase/mutase family protein, partial [Planctomycetaceae bacterium]|nr:terpene cyclase/mutase family protein [Planctomycetaceae bacterium]
ASVPGSHDAFRVGTTALCVMALREAGERKASARGLEYLSSYDGVRRANRAEIYNIWAHLYALEALSRAYAEDKVDAYRKAAESQLRRLEMYETYVGGWNYYDFIYGTEKPSMEPVSFGTAAALVALHEARRAGIAVPDGLVRRSLSRLKEMKNPDGSFLYGSDYRYSPRHLANRDKGSLGRTQSCYYALKLWNEGGVGEAQIREGLERLFREHRFIEIGRKRPMPHEGWYFTAGYYYYFGHYYAARLIEGLADKADYRDRLRSFVLPHQEPDGSWWDFHLYDYGKPYGTSFAIMTLLRCR